MNNGSETALDYNYLNVWIKTHGKIPAKETPRKMQLLSIAPVNNQIEKILEN